MREVISQQDQISDLMIKQLEHSGEFRVLKSLNIQDTLNKSDDSKKFIGCYVDVETTGKNHENDKITEMAMIKFEFNNDGKIFRILDKFLEFEDPNGLYKINDQQVKDFIKDSPSIFAHNASFDRKFLERRFPIFKQSVFLCSMADVSWKERNYDYKSLSYLVNQFGHFHKEHRALSDCEAGIFILSQTFYGGRESVLANLLFNARKNCGQVRLIINGLPPSENDYLKTKGFQWDWNYRVSTKKMGAWGIFLNKSEVDKMVDWLDGFKNRFPALEIQTHILNKYNRYSERIEYE